jgi:uncharacterized membrane protein
VSQSDDHSLEQFIGRVLQVGLLVAASTVAVGGILILAHDGSGVPDFSRFSEPGSRFRALSPIVMAAAHGDAGAIVMAGILVLIATPILRVAFMLGAFARQRDRLYVALSAIVLCILLIGLIS